MRNMLMILLAGAFFLFWGCASSKYVSFYSANGQADAQCAKAEMKYPRIDEILDLEEVQSWRSKGYEVIGTSEFEGLWEPRYYAIDVARKVGATVVLVYSRYKESRYSQRTYIIPTMTYGYTYGTIGTASYTGYTTSTASVPVNVSRYDHFYTQKAFFLAQRKNRNEYGVYFIKPSAIPGQPSTQKIVVDVVIHDSPAAFRGIRPGDIVTHINGNAVTDFEDVVRYMNGEVPIQDISVERSKP